MSENIMITSENMSQLVTEAFFKSLFEKGEDTSNKIVVEGIIRKIGFHPERLQEQKELVQKLLAELPTEFKQGYTFLAFCQNKKGQLWTGDQSVCEQLVTMAIGLDLMEYCLPKTMWSIFPGGVPYVIVK